MLVVIILMSLLNNNVSIKVTEVKVIYNVYIYIRLMVIILV